MKTSHSLLSVSQSFLWNKKSYKPAMNSLKFKGIRRLCAFFVYDNCLVFFCSWVFPLKILRLENTRTESVWWWRQLEAFSVKDHFPGEKKNILTMAETYASVLIDVDYIMSIIFNFYSVRSLRRNWFYNVLC